ncbi:helix-turn-helix transcriptional regulator [Aliiglaciecola sp. M165]|uniref:helix-turn-helix transcriptional regulator n=1 Tax=Aliiglaciecola sp. M165 TaxID=2593649 RepID=UPI00117F46A0|nr:helix-turn-helix transcriptional regulator [Aliiglaciecola sp. M165]TRY30336.1 helix-turn-helix transcriptional regulator [Aliiglaciecola sp. M165]
MNVNEMVAELGTRLKQARLNSDLTQEAIAEKTGLSRKAIINAEKGNAQLKTLVSILIALGLEKHLDNFIPIVSASPLQIAKSQRSLKKRASGKTQLDQDETPSW